MKLSNNLLIILLLVAIGWIIYLYATRPGITEKPPVETALPASTSAQTFNLLFHLEDPLAALERMYYLFPGATFSAIYFGNISPGNQDYYNTVNKTLGFPCISGKNPFPRAGIEMIQKELRDSMQDNAIHFASLTIDGFPPLGMADIKYQEQLHCAFLQKNTTSGGQPIADVISYIQLKLDSTITNRAKKLGFEQCSDTIRHEVYLKDPSGFLILLQNAPPK